MINRVLIELLRCPETQQRVALASEDVVARIEAERAAGGLRNRGGSLIETPIEGCLIREDEAVCFPIRNGIPMMLAGESIALVGVGICQNKVLNYGRRTTL